MTNPNTNTNPRAHHETLALTIERLGARTPTPGGGGAACWSGAIGAALAQMVLAYSIGRKGAPDDGSLETAHARLSTLPARLLELAGEDATAYQRVVDARAARRNDPGPEAKKALEEAESRASGPPAEALELCREAIALLVSLAGKTNPHLESDRAAAIDLLAGAVRASSRFVALALAGDRSPHSEQRRAHLAATLQDIRASEIPPQA